MPELPEVETIALALRSGQGKAPALPGLRIERVSLRWPRHIAAPSPRAFRRNIRARTIEEVGRRGKYLVFTLDRRTLLIHLRMSGDLYLVPEGEPRGRYEHTVFHLREGWDLRFRDSRKFGTVHLLDDPQQVLGKLGPEPLSPSFTAKRFGEMLRSRKRLLKPLLGDQTYLAGMGNIYIDEALHRARIHPLRQSHTLAVDEVSRLHRSIRRALREGLQNNGASIDWIYQGGGFQDQFRVYQRTGEPCPRCGTPIERILVGQRGTHLCPQCQPATGERA